MQNFTDGFLLPVDGLITVPTGEGTEAFVDVAVIGGESTKHNDIDREPYIQAGIDAGANADFVTTIRFLTETVAAGRGSRPTHDVERVTGRSPTAFADFIRRFGRWGGGQR